MKTRRMGISMKPLAWMLLLPVTLFAGVRDDYARQWPLTLGQEAAGAYRVELDRSVYQQLQSPLLKDLEVINAEGVAVAASLFDAEQPLAKSSTRVDVPWFPLPFISTLQSRDIASISEIAADGSLRRVLMKEPDASLYEGDGLSGEYLLDTSRLHEAVKALEITWPTGQEPLDQSIQVTASDDLKNWRTVQDGGRLVELQNNGERIFKNRIDLDPVKAKYLRLVSLRREQRGLRISGVRAELVPPTATQAWQWEEIKGERVVEKDGGEVFVYRIDGRFPFQRADVLLPGNSSNEWILKSRDSEEAEWQHATAPWMAFQVEGGGSASRSPPQSLDGVNRDRYWRLLPKQAVQGEVPVLKLGYRPELVVFLAQGNAPYALVAGSARAQRVDAPLPQLVDALRAQRGASWQPATATLGEGVALAGEQALVPAPVERDWKAWLLWALLIGGALIVAGFAFSLLKKPAAKP